MIHLEWLFLMQLGMGILMFFFLLKLTQMKKQIDEITNEVMNYISFVTKEEEEETAESSEIRRTTYKKEVEEAKNRLIEAVLGEYFP